MIPLTVHRKYIYFDTPLIQNGHVGKAVKGLRIHKYIQFIKIFLGWQCDLYIVMPNT